LTADFPFSAQFTEGLARTEPNLSMKSGSRFGCARIVKRKVAIALGAGSGGLGRLSWRGSLPPPPAEQTAERLELGAD
jgi:hypothetical protein